VSLATLFVYYVLQELHNHLCAPRLRDTQSRYAGLGELGHPRQPPAEAPARPPRVLWATPFVEETEGPAEERRRHLRRRGSRTPVEIEAAGSSGDQLRGAVVDRSQGGLRLRSPQDFAAGSRLRVRSLAYPDVAPWVEVEVVHASADGERWALRCRFTQSQPWGVLLLFG
jgi:hypothetical protein